MKFNINSILLQVAVLQHSLEYANCFLCSISRAQSRDSWSKSSNVILCQSSISNDSGIIQEEEEKEILENELMLIEAIEERNNAQIDSFVDEQDQWESMDEGERQLLLSKDQILQKLHNIIK